MKKSLDTLAARTFLGLFTMLALILAGCVSSGRSSPAPVEDHPTVKKKQAPKATSAAQAPVPAPSAAAPDQTAKPGYYIVKQGDTLIRIGLDHGQNWRDIMRWNALENPNLIEVGQVLLGFTKVLHHCTHKHLIFLLEVIVNALQFTF